MPPNDVDYYIQYVEAIDEGGEFEVTDREAEFIESLLTEKPKFLSTKQIKWIQDMAYRYLKEEIH